MNVIRILVLINVYGTDAVYVDTDLPSPFPDEVDSSPLTLKFEVQRGKGVEYVLSNFPEGEVETLCSKTGKREKVR